ncbi:MAG: hypothetical protein Q4D58_03430 [Synergistaceae bacterium]|nr:hypothetical protein [Synergistaceae bacterium]
MNKAALFLCLVYYIAISSLSPAAAVTAKEFAAAQNCRIDADALALMESLGELTYLDSAFILRIAPLPPERQRALALRLASDGHMTVEKLKQVPLAVAVPEDPGDIIPLLYEQLKEDYWRGWLKRHSFMADVKMREWKDSAKRRFVDPDLAIRLIDIFFQKRAGSGSKGGVTYLYGK